MRLSTNFDTRQAFYYSLIAAYILFILLMTMRSIKRDRQLSTIENQIGQLREMVASEGLDA